MNRGWLETEAEVTSCGSVNACYGMRGQARPGFYAVGFTYKVNGISYEGATNSPVAKNPALRPCSNAPVPTCRKMALWVKWC